VICFARGLIIRRFPSVGTLQADGVGALRSSVRRRFFGHRLLCVLDCFEDGGEDVPGGYRFYRPSDIEGPLGHGIATVIKTPSRRGF